MRQAVVVNSLCSVAVYPNQQIGQINAAQLLPAPSALFRKK
jgi:hypothetical protein